MVLPAKLSPAIARCQSIRLANIPAGTQRNCCDFTRLWASPVRAAYCHTAVVSEPCESWIGQASPPVFFTGARAGRLARPMRGAFLLVPGLSAEPNGHRNSCLGHVAVSY